eukprot:56860_1
MNRVHKLTNQLQLPAFEEEKHDNNTNQNYKALQLGPDEFLFSSESVNEGHPYKLCDLVSDDVLDACLAQDPNYYVACETAAKTGMVMIFGEITNKAKVDYEDLVSSDIKNIRYDAAEKCIYYKTCTNKVA